MTSHNEHVNNEHFNGRPGIGIYVTRDTVFSNLSRDMLNHELPSLSPVSMFTEKTKMPNIF